VSPIANHSAILSLSIEHVSRSSNMDVASVRQAHGCAFGAAAEKYV